MKAGSKELFYNDAEMGFVELRRTRSSAKSFRPHMHRRFSVGCVDSGRVQFTVEEQDGVLEPGALVVINPETLHACNSLEPSGRSYSMLYLDVFWCCCVQQSLWRTESFIPAQVHVLQEQDVFERFQALTDLLFDDVLPCGEKEETLVDFCRGLFKKVCRSKTPAGLPNNVQVEQLKAILQADLHKDFTLESLAELLGCNPYTLIRHFKAQTGLTPHNYRMNCRIEYARKLLSRGADIAQVALDCGFFDQSHFHRHFKAMTTVTPREYQRNFVQ
jgi:AraC-like DNA-binding protein